MVHGTRQMGYAWRHAVRTARTAPGARPKAGKCVPEGDTPGRRLTISRKTSYICPVDRLDNDIKYVPGVGEARAKLLDRELGIRTLGDMLRHFPFRYIDRTRIYRIAEITDGAGTRSPPHEHPTLPLRPLHPSPTPPEGMP